MNIQFSITDDKELYFRNKNVRYVIRLAASNGKRIVTVWRPSVCPSVCPHGILNVTQQGAACDSASVYFGPTVRKTDVLALLGVNTDCSSNFNVLLCFQKLRRYGAAMEMRYVYTIIGQS